MGDWDEDPTPTPCPVEGCPHAYVATEAMKLHLAQKHGTPACAYGGVDAEFCECAACNLVKP